MNTKCFIHVIQKEIVILLYQMIGDLSFNPHSTTGSEVLKITLCFQQSLALKERKEM